MHNTYVHSKRNQSMECCKMFASILVVFLHVSFPGTIDGFVKSFSCFAVPVFFAISGYFNYGADKETLTRRLKHLLQLYLTAILVNLVWGCLMTEYQGGSTIAYLRCFVPDLEEIANWLIFQLDPRMGHLWYLSSACLCYWILRVYVRFFGEKPVNYRPLYIISLCLFSVFLALGVILPLLGMDIPYLLYRNAYFMGLPMFTLGIFIHEYQEQILTNYQLTTRKQLLIILAGVLLSLLQGNKLGMGQMTLGAIAEVVMLMIFLVAHPIVTSHAGVWDALIAKFGAWSTYIYLFHVIILQLYLKFFEASFSAAMRQWEPYLRPFAVAALSFLFAVIFERGEWLIKQIFRCGSRR